MNQDPFRFTLFRLQFDFFLGHESTHDVYRHFEPRPTGSLSVWTEFLQDERCGSLEQQAQELDADGYSSYVLLANLLQVILILSTGPL